MKSWKKSAAPFPKRPCCRQNAVQSSGAASLCGVTDCWKGMSLHSLAYINWTASASKLQPYEKARKVWSVAEQSYFYDLYTCQTTIKFFAETGASLVAPRGLAGLQGILGIGAAVPEWYKGLCQCEMELSIGCLSGQATNGPLVLASFASPAPVHVIYSGNKPLDNCHNISAQGVVATEQPLCFIMSSWSSAAQSRVAGAKGETYGVRCPCAGRLQAAHRVRHAQGAGRSWPHGAEHWWPLSVLPGRAEPAGVWAVGSGRAFLWSAPREL